MTTTIQRRRGRRAVAATAIAPLLALAYAGAAHADSAPLTWTFEKCATSGSTWEGTATGPDGTVALRTELTGLRETARIWHVSLDWEVGDLYLARLNGTLNLNDNGDLSVSVTASTPEARSTRRASSSTPIAGASPAPSP